MTEGEQLARAERLVQITARRFYLPGAERDDLLQELRIAALKAIRTYSPTRGATLDGFIMMACHHAAVSAVKLHRAGKRLVITDAVRLDGPAPGFSNMDDPILLGDVLPDYRAGTERQAEARVALDQLMCLPLSDIEAGALMHRMAGSSYAEACADLHCSEKSYDNACQRLRRKAVRALGLDELGRLAA